MLRRSTEEILAVMRRKGYVIFSNQSKNFNLNLVGIRSKTNKPNAFDDLMCAIWLFDDRWHQKAYQITTDPGLYWLKNPMHVDGTAILKEGQYRGLWEIGQHQGRYKALVQARPCTVIRDANRDDRLDFSGGIEDVGLFGINCHRAAASGTSAEVDKWSAGCQVFANAKDFQEFMCMCEIARINWGNSFTYTLLNERDFEEVTEGED